MNTPDPTSHASEQVGSALDMLCEVEDCTEIAERRCRKHASEQGAEDEWQDDSPASKKPNSILVENYLRMFVQDILHGDEDHKKWLLEAAECFIEGRHMPERPCPCLSQRPTPATVKEMSDALLGKPTPWPGSNPNKGVPESYVDKSERLSPHATGNAEPQEWTPEYVESLAQVWIGDGACLAIADAHNATLKLKGTR